MALDPTIPLPPPPDPNAPSIPGYVDASMVLTEAPATRSSAGTSSPTLVREAQGDLNSLGYASPPLVVDGDAGPLTAAAARKFQAARGLTPDGALGASTLAALRAAVASPSAPVAPAGVVSPNAAPTIGTTVAVSSANLKWYAGGAALLALIGVAAAAAHK